MTDAIANVADRSPQTSLGTAVAGIMVYVDFDPGSDDRIKIAADWAAKFGAVLIGVAGWLPGRQVGGWFAAELERPEDRIDRIMAELEKLAEHFRNLVGRAVRSSAARLAAIPAGESPVNRDAMGPRRGYCIHRR